MDSEEPPFRGRCAAYATLLGLHQEPRRFEITVESEFINRAFDVLTVLAQSPSTLSVREVADRTGLASSTAHRLMQTLEARGVLTKDAQSQQYRLGPVVSQLGFAALQDLDVHSLALPHMQTLQSLTGETVAICVRVDDARVYLDQLVSSHELKAVLELGQHYPLHSGAPAYALIAFLDDEEIDALLDRIDIVAPTDNAPGDKQAVWDAIKRTKSKGYAVAFGETATGLNTIAVPIFSRDGRPVAALSVSGPIHRFTEQSMDAAIPGLLSARDSISFQMGYDNSLSGSLNPIS